MVASVAKVNRVCVAAMVTDGASDFVVMMVTLITKLPVLHGYLCYHCYQGCWLPWLRESTTCVLVYVFCLCHLSISTYIGIQGKWLKQGLVYTQVLDGPIYNVQFLEKYLFRMCLKVSPHFPAEKL
jgi:hypothetical protein